MIFSQSIKHGNFNRLNMVISTGVIHISKRNNEIDIVKYHVQPRHIELLQITNQEREMINTLSFNQLWNWAFGGFTVKQSPNINH